jgi:hypothetical protein
MRDAAPWLETGKWQDLTAFPEDADGKRLATLGRTATTRIDSIGVRERTTRS